MKMSRRSLFWRCCKWVLLALTLGALASCASPVAINPPVSSIRVVMDNNYPPYAFLDAQGNPQGISVDQWKLWEKHTGIKVEIFAIRWEDALSDMKSGKYDVIDTIFYTEERAKTYDFTDAYARIDVPIFFQNNISGIARAEDLRGFRVAVKTGDADAEYLMNAGVTDLVYYNSYEEIIQAVSRKEETIFAMDQPPALYFLYKYGLQEQFNHSEPLFSGAFHRAVKKGDTALLNQIVEGFAAIDPSEYQAIEEHWLGIPQESVLREYAPYLGGGAMIVVLVIFTLIVFNRTLQNRVQQRVEEIRVLNAGLEQRVRERTAQLEAANKELEAFSYSISHDLRAPLRGIDGWSQALLEDYRDNLDEQGRQYIDRVRSETQRMGHLIEDMLQLSRLTRAEMRKELVDLSALAHAISERLQKEEPQRRVEFFIQENLAVNGDERLLESALTNLLGNAFKFTGARAEARIEFGQTEIERQRVFFVRDNGAGFDMAYAQKLFTAFQRLHKTAEFPGTGIGLATVQRIIQRHGGKVWAEAKVNEGAVFYFIIPA